MSYRLFLCCVSENQSFPIQVRVRLMEEIASVFFSLVACLKIDHCSFGKCNNLDFRVADTPSMTAHKLCDGPLNSQFIPFDATSIPSSSMSGK